jgi:hypothetical protein
MQRRRAHLRKLHTFSGIEVDHQPVGLLDRARAAAPAVECDRIRSGARRDAVHVGYVEIVLGAPVLLLDRLEPHRRLERVA